MSELDIIRDLAKQTLTIPTPASNLDSSLWDRAQRLVRNVEHICRLPELSNTSLQIDHFCLMAATYFSDAGLAGQLKAKRPAASSILPDTNNNDLADFSAQATEEKLAGIIEKTKIGKISGIITESASHSAKMTEAMILSDARNLDDMGAAGIFNEFRRYVIEGKSISDALQSWKKKVDYMYWQARLKESFRFEQVRKLAERRLATAKYFMNQLKVENIAQDLEELTLDSAFV